MDQLQQSRLLNMKQQLLHQLLPQLPDLLLCRLLNRSLLTQGPVQSLDRALPMHLIRKQRPYQILRQLRSLKKCHSQKQLLSQKQVLSLNQLQRMDQLQSLKQLQSLRRLQRLERLQSLKQLQSLK